MSDYLETGFPFSGLKLKKLKTFLKEQNLTYDESIEFSVNLCSSQGEILGTGSRDKNILKCIAVSKKSQGEGLLNTIMTQLFNNAFAADLSHLFLFTKPSNELIFEDYGFWGIAKTSEILLMENKKEGIIDYLKEASLKSPLPLSNEKSGAIVMNANPFTKGHLYLIETALNYCDHLHVFILDSGNSQAFPKDIRFHLVKEGCKNLKNVIIHHSSDYLISYATFPDYFLKDKSIASESAGALDLLIFSKYFCPAFNISIRFIGEEPFCETTYGYNQKMKTILPSYGIEVLEIPRLIINTLLISASYIRKAFLAGDTEKIKPYVPVTTFNFLISKEGQALRESFLK